MLRVAEHAHHTDRGRQRQGNEDSWFARSPLFAVADGMGGAQAGEVASSMAVEEFEPGLPAGDAAAGLVSIISTANERIHERSRREAGHAGMGTTVTAAYVTADAVVVAHVGDSRAYRLRDGTLEPLTRDHSLVEELKARGKLTAEEAEVHPQRSVITRALGPEAGVEVETSVVPGQDGDVLLLCSDGLTGMVPEPRLRDILVAAPSLERAARELIDAANEAGGRDNITVVLFRLEEVAAEAGAPADRGERPTVVGDDALRATQVREAVARAKEAEQQANTAEYPGPVAASAGGSGAGGDADGPPPARAARRRRHRVPPAVLVALFLVLIVLIGAWIATRAVYFLGTDPGDGNVVAIYRGVPYELPGGVRLYEHHYSSGVPITSVPGSRRATFTDHQLRAREDAESLVQQLELGQIDP